MTFNWAFDIGNITAIATMIGGLVLWVRSQGGAYGDTRRTLLRMQEDIHELKNMQKQITELLLQIAVQQNTVEGLIKQITILDQRIEDLRHLKGFIIPPGKLESI
tara:strand:- start:86 stop:400 length:315 start_codon:yes stop_codon:yes gene_type:complete